MRIWCSSAVCCFFKIEITPSRAHMVYVISVFHPKLIEHKTLDFDICTPL